MTKRDNKTQQKREKKCKAFILKETKSCPPEWKSKMMVLFLKKRNM